MPMLCIAGVTRIVGTEPDGDSIRFVPDEPADWGAVGGPHAVRVNSQGGAQLRLDGIDALETHYAPPRGHRLHQPLDLAHAASAELLSWLGHDGVERRGEKVVTAASDDRPAYVLTRSADKYGRCVALLGRGKAPGLSGRPIYTDVDTVRATANHALLTSGLAYPTFYSALFHDLRDELSAASVAARAAGRGVYARDVTRSGVVVASLATLTDDAVLLPKLFRRLVDYLQLGSGDVSLARFADYLRQRNDRLYVIPTAQRTGLDTLVEVDGQSLRLTVDPEDIVFEEG
jgi:endonuclease YncB( thermonuclease family)